MFTVRLGRVDDMGIALCMYIYKYSNSYYFVQSWTHFVRPWGDPRRGSPYVKTVHWTVFTPRPAFRWRRGFRALRSAPRALPLDPAALSRKGGRKAFNFARLKLSFIIKPSIIINFAVLVKNFVDKPRIL